MKDIDWDKAPPWANVVICAELGAHFWCPAWGGQQTVENIQTGLTQYATMSGDHSWHLVASRHEVVWTGEGLPPVGLAVEWLECNQTGWQEVTVLAYANGEVWIQPKGKSSIVVYNAAGFRPIRTPEQIAAEEREKAIEALAVELAGHWSSEAVSLQRETAAYLHDIGYRRVEQ